MQTQLICRKKTFDLRDVLFRPPPPTKATFPHGNVGSDLPFRMEMELSIRLTTLIGTIDCFLSLTYFKANCLFERTVRAKPL